MTFEVLPTLGEWEFVFENVKPKGNQVTGSP
jgi:hypothetical protein